VRSDRLGRNEAQVKSVELEALQLPATREHMRNQLLVVSVVQRNSSLLIVVNC